MFNNPNFKQVHRISSDDPPNHLQRGFKVRIGHIGAINVMPKAELILEVCRKELWKEGVLNEDFDIELEYI